MNAFFNLLKDNMFYINKTNIDLNLLLCEKHVNLFNTINKISLYDHGTFG